MAVSFLLIYTIFILNGEGDARGIVDSFLLSLIPGFIEMGFSMYRGEELSPHPIISVPYYLIGCLAEEYKEAEQQIIKKKEVKKEQGSLSISKGINGELSLIDES